MDLQFSDDYQLRSQNARNTYLDALYSYLYPKSEWMTRIGYLRGSNAG